MKTLRDLQKEAYRIAVEHGWHDDEPDILKKVEKVPARLMLIVTEAGEAMEEFRNPDRILTSVYMADGTTKPEGFGPEVADIIIRCLDMLEDVGLDAQALVEQKMAYNETRSYRHGGKRI